MESVESESQVEAAELGHRKILRSQDTGGAEGVGTQENSVEF